jgi:hypothetical protein
MQQRTNKINYRTLRHNCPFRGHSATFRFVHRWLPTTTNSEVDFRQIAENEISLHSCCHRGYNIDKNMTKRTHNSPLKSAGVRTTTVNRGLDVPIATPIKATRATMNGRSASLSNERSDAGAGTKAVGAQVGL